MTDLMVGGLSALVMFAAVRLWDRIRLRKKILLIVNPDMIDAGELAKLLNSSRVIVGILNPRSDGPAIQAIEL